MQLNHETKEERAKIFSTFRKNGVYLIGLWSAFDE